MPNGLIITGRLHGPDELLVGAPISVARDEQERRPRWRPPLQRDADDYRGTRALVILGFARRDGHSTPFLSAPGLLILVASNRHQDS